MPATLTVAIPTHNRADLLRETLASIAAQRIPPEVSADCVVIDNASSDDTRAAVESAARSAPFPVRHVLEHRVGSSYARNRAVNETASGYIFFIDDDAVAAPDWAAELLAEIEHRNLDAACGAVLPNWTAPPPAWLGPSLYSKLAVHDERMLAAPFASVEDLANYYSANVGFRRAAFERFGRFREDLGVVGGRPFSGEDTELFARIIARGGRLGFAPRAIVRHTIGAERMTRAYLVRKSFAFGMGSAVAGGKSHNRIDKLARNVARLVGAAVRGDSERVVYHQLECANFLGYWRARLLSRRA
ncbi:MAG: glycosyltransferase family 2 protein [Candidatus Binataceae bacterium]